MSRKGVGGRPRKPTDKHKEEGTFRKHRHAKRVDAQVQSGIPPIPGDLDDEGREAWRLITTELPKEIFNRVDRFVLHEFCECWSLSCKLRPQMAADPLDKDIRIAWTSTKDRLIRLGALVGWSPQSRAGLQMPDKPEEEIDPMAVFLQRRLGRGD